MNKAAIALLAPLFLTLTACNGNNEGKDIGVTPENLTNANQEADQANVIILRKWNGQSYTNNEIKTRRDCFNEAYIPTKSNAVESAKSYCFNNGVHIGNYFCEQSAITKDSKVSTSCTEFLACTPKKTKEGGDSILACT